MRKRRLSDEEAAANRKQFTDLLYELRFTQTRLARLLNVRRETIASYVSGASQVMPVYILALHAIRAHYGGAITLPTSKGSARPPTWRAAREAPSP